MFCVFIKIIFRVYPAAAQVERIPGSGGQRFGSRLGMAPSSCFFLVKGSFTIQKLR